MTPAPSPRAEPVARASKVLQRPSGAIAPALLKLIVTAGERIRLTPPDRARLDSPRRRLVQASCTATSDEEHAVSSARLGPRKSNKYEIRFAAMLSALPVPAYASMRLKSFSWMRP